MESFSQKLIEIFPHLTPMPVGKITGLPNDAYQKTAALSQSWAKTMRRSPAHAHYGILNPRPTTLTLDLGNALHCAVLEPEAFMDKYIVLPVADPNTYCNQDGSPSKSPGSTKAYKAAVAELKANSPTATVLSADHATACEGMRHEIWDNAMTSALLNAKGTRELSVFWEDETGVIGRARFDHVVWDLDGGTIVDIKTTEDASEVAFERDIYKYGYHMQGAWYLRAAASLGMPIKNYAILPVEKKPPYCLGLYTVTSGAIEAGWDQLEPAVERFARCVERNDWPGYKASRKVVPIALPHWAWGQIEEESMR